MTDKKLLLMLGANQYLRERALAGARQCTDAQVWIADVNGITEKNRYFDGCFLCSPFDTEKLIFFIEQKISEGYILQSVIPLNDWVLKTANEVNRYFKLRYLSESVINGARNKFLMKEKFNQYNIPNARYYLLQDDKEIRHAIEYLGFPVIIKPYDFGGSGGVFVAKNEQDALQKLTESRKVIHKYKDDFKISGDKYLIEEYIDSTEEVSLEIICFDGKYKTLSVTEKYLSAEPWFSEMAHLVPSHRNHDVLLNKIAHAACQALNITMGIAHVEVKIKHGEYYVIEAAARPGGDGIMDQIERAFGVNPYYLHILSYLGVDATHIVIPEPSGTAAIAFLKAPVGIIKKINTPVQHIKATDEMVSLKITASAGASSHPPENWSCREGVVEFYWPDTFFNKKTDLPVQQAAQLARELFIME